MSKHMHYKFCVEISVSSPEFIAALRVFPFHTAARYVPSILYIGHIPARGHIRRVCRMPDQLCIAAIFSWLLLVDTAMVEIISKYVNNRHSY